MDMALASAVAELEASMNKWLFQDNNFVSIEEIQRLQKKHTNGKKMNLQARESEELLETALEEEQQEEKEEDP